MPLSEIFLQLYCSFTGVDNPYPYDNTHEFSLTSSPSGMSINSNSGVISWNVGNASTGTVSFTPTDDSLYDASSNETATIAISGVSGGSYGGTELSSGPQRGKAFGFRLGTQIFTCCVFSTLRNFDGFLARSTEGPNILDRFYI